MNGIDKTTSLVAPFVEDPPEVLDDIRPRTNAEANNKKTSQRKTEKRWSRLPDDGPGILRVAVVGPRIVLSPSDKQAARMLDQVRSQLGRHWDNKQRDFVYHFDMMLRRGTAQFDSLRLIAALCGLKLDVSPSIERAVNRYLRRLERQLRPIPRFIWTDDTIKATESVVKDEIDLDGSSFYRQRIYR